MMLCVIVFVDHSSKRYSCGACVFKDVVVSTGLRGPVILEPSCILHNKLCSQCDVDAGFSAFWSVTMAYFIIDFAWILLEPRCVKSPSVLLTHHVVAASYMFLPFFYPFTAPKMSYVMTVEVLLPAQHRPC